MNIKFYPLDIPRDWAWVREHNPVVLMENTKGIVAVDISKPGGERVGVCVMDSWSHNSVQVHMFIQNSMLLRHGFLEAIGNYVFNTCQKELMIGLVPDDNDAALRLNAHIGFKEMYRIEDGYMQGIDMVLLEARREDLARWLQHEEAA